ncbi:hypothetical protein F0562_003164 [Nyssa sinensis]|uniref:PB1 domain-containing protein n=1 Tax=Nyssa sinensis TaxID=561372 RepID=A0A5J5BUM0_9ASTE|nr:hypothetical protein F0562_003164 [Nyssa sinensis]
MFDLALRIGQALSAQSPEHLNTNVMAPPQVGSVSPPADGLTWQDGSVSPGADGLTWPDQAASEFVLDCKGATLDDSLTVSDQSPEHLNTSVMPPPQVGSVSPRPYGLTSQDQAASEFVLDGYGATLDNSLTVSDQSPEHLNTNVEEDILVSYAQWPEHLNTNVEEDILVSDAQSPEHLNTNVMAPPQVGSVSPRADWLTWQVGSVSLRPYELTFSDRPPMSPGDKYFNDFSSQLDFFCQLSPQRMLTDPNNILDFNCSRLTDLCVSECGPLENLKLESRNFRVRIMLLTSIAACQFIKGLELKSSTFCTTPKGCSLEVRHDEIINPSADGKLDLRLQCMQICVPAGSQSGPQALPDGEMIQVDSLQHEEIVECAATNNGGNVGGEGPSLTAITLSKKNKRKMSERKCTTDKSIDLVDLQQHYGKTREDAAKSLGVSISTFKRRCREYGISRWPSHKINKDKQSLSTSTRKGVTKSVLGAEGSHNPNSVSPKLLPGAVGTVSWSSSLNGSHRGYIQGSKEGRTWILTSHDVCLGNSIKETPPAMDLFISPTHKECIEVGSFPELAYEPTDSEPQRPLGGISKNLSNFFSSAAEADLEGRISESDCTDLPCSDPGSKQAMATLSCPMPHVGAKQDTKKVTIKAEYGEDKIRFQMSSTSGIDELKEEVTKRLMLKANTFSIKYEDDDGDWILIACDADLQESMIMSSSSANNKIRLLVHDKIDNSRKSTKSCRGLKSKRL